MEQNINGQSITINQRMNVYNFNNNNCTLTINEAISNITINGSKNKIILKARIPNMILNGSKNEINSEHKNSHISNVILNGSYNKISCNRRNMVSNKIDNGSNNLITVHGEPQANSNSTLNGGNFNPFSNQFFNNFNNFGNSNSNYTIRINNNFGNLNPNNIFDFINNITENVNMQFGQQRDSYNINIQESFSSATEEEVESLNEDEANEEAYREYLMNKREELVLDLNEFQYKNAHKFLSRKDDTCAICLEKFKNPDIVKQFSCLEHIFHKMCLSSWLEKSNYCPLCKHDLMDDIVVEDGDQ